ncbi:unnamed protein product, partial [Pleuronectes platessa]
AVAALNTSIRAPMFSKAPANADQARSRGSGGGRQHEPAQPSAKGPYKNGESMGGGEKALTAEVDRRKQFGLQRDCPAKSGRWGHMETFPLQLSGSRRRGLPRLYHQQQLQIKFLNRTGKWMKSRDKNMMEE